MNPLKHEPAISDALDTFKHEKRCLIFLCIKKYDTKKVSNFFDCLKQGGHSVYVCVCGGGGVYHNEFLFIALILFNWLVLKSIPSCLKIDESSKT